MTADYVRALRVERDEYVARGLIDRVAQVDAELARCGEPVEAAPPAAEKRPASKRTAKPKG